MRTVFPDGTIRQLQIQNDGTVESVFFDGNTWGLNWSSKNSDNLIATKSNGAIVYSGNCDDFGFGIYLCDSGVQNLPHNNWHMIISAVGNGTGVQIGIALFNKDIRVRSLISGVWEDWSGIQI